MKRLLPAILSALVVASVIAVAQVNNFPPIFSSTQQGLVPPSAISITPTTITNLAAPSASSDAATKTYVDSLVTNFDIKNPVVAATNAVLLFSPSYANGSSGVGATLTGSIGVLIVDGYTPLLGDRILVKNEASALTNGIYTVTRLGTIGVGYILTRATDFNSAGNIIYGDTVAVLQGTANANQQFTMNVQSAITVGSTAITFAQTSGGSQLTAGSGISVTGNTIAVSAAPLTGLATQAANTAVANVTSGTAAPTAATLPSCADTGGNHLNYTNGTGFSCGTSSGGASGALIKISTQTASGGANIAWTGLDSTYNTLFLDCNAMVPNGTNTGLTLQVGTGVTPTYQTTTYFTDIWYESTGEGGTISSTASEANTFISLDKPRWQTGTGNSMSGKYWISNVSTTLYKIVQGEFANFGTNSHLDTGKIAGIWHGATTVVTALRVGAQDSGNINSGQCTLYGLSP